MEKRKENTIRLVTSGIMIALATILSMIKVFEGIYGGSITLFSMVPIMVLGYMYGWKWGLLSGTVYGILQAVLGAATTQAFAGLTGFNVVLMALLDYIIAFAVLGLAGMFRNKIKNDIAAFALGAFITAFLRYVAHFLSGFILWKEYAAWFFEDVFTNELGQSILANIDGDLLVALYSAIYNGSYMIPEIILSVVGVIIIMAVKPLRNEITSKNKTI